MIKLRPEPKSDSIVTLVDLLQDSIHALSKPGANVSSGCAALAAALKEIEADPDQVRAIARDVIYDGDRRLAEDLMNYLARYSFGSGAVTVQQPSIHPPGDTVSPVKDPEPALSVVNLLAELAVSDPHKIKPPKPYSALFLSEKGVGVTTLLQAVIAEYLRHPCDGVTVRVADLFGESWCGLAKVENTVYHLPPRDPKFLESFSTLVAEVAREIQSRVAQRSLRERSATLGADRWAHWIFVIDGWHQVTEHLSLLTKKQIHDHPHAGSLLSNLRYCLSSGPSVSVSSVLSADRLDNCALTETALDNARIFALGAVRSQGWGGYRSVDALLANKNRLPDSRDRARLSKLLERCKTEKTPVVLALSGLPRLGLFNDFRDESLDLYRLYEDRRVK